MNKRVDFSTLVGKTLVAIHVGDEEINFLDSEGHKYKMYHQQDCCESVWLEDVNGDWDDLLGNPITVAEERTSYAGEEGDIGEPADNSYIDDSYTWTFYTISTIKGTVDLRWFGTSNGYYSETADFLQVE